MRPRSDPKLRRWYRRNNRRFFGGRLTGNVLLIYETVPGAFGDCLLMPDGYFRIRVNPIPGTGHRTHRFTLIHEMAHVKLWPDTGHGATFDAEMMRLANTGALKGLW